MGETKDEGVKKIVVTSDDIVTGREIADPRKEPLVSDDRVRQILQRFAPTLHKGIAEADTFFSRSVGDRYADATPMLEDEIELWDALFGLRHVISEKAEQGKLYIPEVVADDSRLLTPPLGTQEPNNYSKELRVAGSGGRQFRVNLDRVVWTPILPFNPKDMRLYIKPRAHLGGQGRAYGEGVLYNAFIAIDTYVQDALGRWVVEQIPGTGVHSWDSGPVYSPLRPVGADVWFNTTVNQAKPNILTSSVDKPEYLMLHCDINHPEQLGNLPILKDQRLRLFFWQLDRFMRPISIGGHTRPALLGSGS
ncbi:MAG: hypothetical protein M1514_02385 [Patescibacteria group bacterium]|nr:hypothetical protein [Patescibacteria group bacterium]